ncbi:shikimate kinase [Calothrix sp. NIES-4071]|nr:shikimate kinase [Calothrix sp. NIES-4071]BAZ58949.1 shikimate kinase [Calothrix sp. NIES-4105]
MTDLLQGLNIYLIGMMGAGKTTVGRLLAEHLQYRFLDTDDVITKAAGKTINELFAQNGEEAFRSLESDVLSKVCAHTKLAVATGGGIILQRRNWSYLHCGLVVWLDAPIDLLYNRLAADTTRPLLQDADPKEKLRTLAEKRQALYSEADLHITIATDETPEQTTQKIITAIPSVLKSNTSLN